MHFVFCYREDTYMNGAVHMTKSYKKYTSFRRTFNLASLVKVWFKKIFYLGLFYTDKGVDIFEGLCYL